MGFPDPTDRDQFGNFGEKDPDFITGDMLNELDEKSLRHILGNIVMVAQDDPDSRTGKAVLSEVRMHMEIAGIIPPVRPRTREDETYRSVMRETDEDRAENTQENEQKPFFAPHERTWDFAEAAEYLGCTEGTLKVPFIKVGRLARFRKSDLDQFMDRNLVPAEEEIELGSAIRAEDERGPA